MIHHYLPQTWPYHTTPLFKSFPMTPYGVSWTWNWRLVVVWGPPCFPALTFPPSMPKLQPHYLTFHSHEFSTLFLTLMTLPLYAQIGPLAPNAPFHVICLTTSYSHCKTQIVLPLPWSLPWSTTWRESLSHLGSLRSQAFLHHNPEHSIWEVMFI